MNTEDINTGWSSLMCEAYKTGMAGSSAGIIAWMTNALAFVFDWFIHEQNAEWPKIPVI